MKVFVALAFMVLALSASAKFAISPDEKKELMDFGLGVMMGLNITNRVPDMINCIFENET